MPTAYDLGGEALSNRSELRVYVDPYNEGANAHLRMYRTYNVNDPDAAANEAVWVWMNEKVLGRRRANLLLRFVEKNENPDLIIHHVRSRDQTGWVRPHSLQGQLLAYRC